MKKRKEEILRNKEQSPVQPTKESSVQSTVQSTEQSICPMSIKNKINHHNDFISLENLYNE